MIEAINISCKMALLEDGTVLPITHFFDIDGGETEDPNDAHSFVAGCAGRWFVDLCSDFEGVATQ